MLVDVKKAFLYVSINWRVYIRLPEEDEKAKEGKWMGRLEKAMCGTRDAPAAWQSEVERTMKETGFKQSPTTPCVCFNEATNVRVVVHVDNFLCTGPEPGLANLRRCLQNKYVIKFEILGAGANEKKAGKFLGRATKWTENDLTYKGDDKFLESLLEEWNVHGMTAVQTPGERINSEVDKTADVGKTSEKLGSFTVNEESVRKLRCEFEGGPSWKDVCFIDQILIETLEMFLNESGMSEVCLRGLLNLR